jgi:hypothetical protein
MKHLALVFACCVLAWPVSAAPALNGGVHDFDFALGAFHTHIRRLQDPLTGSSTWLTYDGTKTDVPILGDTGSLEQIEADGPSHLELMTLRLYNAHAHQWSLNFSDSESGALGTPVDRRIPEWRRHVPGSGEIQGLHHSGAPALVGDHAQFLSFRTGVLGRFRQDMGDELLSRSGAFAKLVRTDDVLAGTGSGY